MNIANKTILITGANRGIGRELVNEALKRGVKKVYAGTRASLQVTEALERRSQHSCRKAQRMWVEADEKIHMCPACIASTAVMVASAGTGGGILALFIAKFRKFFRANRLGLTHRAQEK